MRSKTSSRWISHPLSVALTMNFATRVPSLRPSHHGRQACGCLARHLGRRGRLPYALLARFWRAFNALLMFLGRAMVLQSRPFHLSTKPRPASSPSLVVQTARGPTPARHQLGRPEFGGTHPARALPKRGASPAVPERVRRVSVKFLYAW
jgi:hypothetical protein